MSSLLLALIYLLFVSLGLPDALLGSSWPNMHIDMNVPLSYCGIISFIIAFGTIISSLFSDFLIKRFKTGVICAVSVLLTSLALFGFSLSTSFWMLVFFAIPFGLGAGAIDASLNNYVATHYKTRHMSWLHSMWGLGASIGPYIMGLALNNTNNWENGYRVISIIQMGLTIIAFICLPLWTKAFKESPKKEKVESVPLTKVLKIEGVLALMISFFAYIALEQTSILWGSSYLVLNNGLTEEIAASFGSLFLIGMTIGRIINGFLSYKMSDTKLIRLGEIIILLGIILIYIPNINILTLIGLGLIGLGCAPIYPCIMHSIPLRFGKDKSQSIIGLQMAFAYTGTCLMPPLFGIIANNISISLLPTYLIIILILLIVMYEIVVAKTKRVRKTI